MLIKKYISKTSNLFAENRLLKFAIVVLAIVELHNYQKVSEALKYQKTVLIPPTIEEKIEISGYKFSNSYLKAMGIYIANLLHDFTPKTVKGQYAAVSQFLDPSIYPEKSKELEYIAKKYWKNMVSSDLKINKITLEIKKKSGKISLKGKRFLYIYDEPARLEEIEIDILYKNDNGLFHIKDIKHKVTNQSELIK